MAAKAAEAIPIVQEAVSIPVIDAPVVTEIVPVKRCCCTIRRK